MTLGSSEQTSGVAIEVRELWHSFGSRDVLQALSFSVRYGEIFGLIGTSGAGKTTTIRILATALTRTRGEVRIAGFDATLEPALARRYLGYLPELQSAHERITVEEYLTFFAAARGLAADSVAKSVSRVQIGELAKEEVRRLGPGMRQKLGLARVLLHDPQILILDEPTNTLDPKARLEFRDLLLALRAENKAILLSSSVLPELSEIADTVGILDRGRLVAQGPITTLADHVEGRSRREGLVTAPKNVAQQPMHAAQTAAVHESASEPRDIESTIAPSDAIPGDDAESKVNPTGLGNNSARTVPSETGSARLRLRFAGDQARVLGLLRDFAAITVLDELNTGLVVVHYRGGDEFIPELTRHLVSHGVAVLGLEPLRSELERVFQELLENSR